jgi:RNA polymerase sigma factor (sigma-70 family)
MTISDQERNKIFEKYIHLAEEEAKRKQRKVPPCVIYDDLLSAAYVGLLDAASKYDEEKVVTKGEKSFEIYARFRIKGSINDWLRSCNWGKRNDHFKMMTLETTVLFERENGTTWNLKDSIADDRYNVVNSVNSKQLFSKLLKDLPFVVKKIFHLRYIDELTMAEIGDKVGLTESRISQLISDYSHYLNKKWKKGKKDLCEEL